MIDKEILRRIPLQELKNAIANQEDRFFHNRHMPIGDKLIISAKEMTMYKKTTDVRERCQRHSVPDDVGFTSVTTTTTVKIEKFDLTKVINWSDFKCVRKGSYNGKRGYYSKVYEADYNRAEYEELKKQYLKKPVVVTSDYYSASDDDGGNQLYAEHLSNNY